MPPLPSGGPGWASPSSSREGRGWFLQTVATAQKTASIKLKTSKHQTEKQNNLFWFAIRAKLQCNKYQTGDQNKLFCF